MKDQDGVPIPFQPTSYELLGENILFEISRFNPAYELIEKFPEVSISLVDMDSVLKYLVAIDSGLKGVNPTGLQAKGLARKVGEKFNLEIFELYDVIPRDGIDLNVSIYRKKLSSAQAKFSKTFRFASYNSSVPQDILNEAFSLRDKAHSQIIPSIFATIDPSTGIPNIALRWIVEITKDSWVFGDLTRHKTQINIEKPSPTSILIPDTIPGQGILGIGWISSSTSPELKRKIEDFWKTKGLNVPVIKSNLFHPEQIYRISRVSFTKLFEARPRSQWLLSG